MKNYMKKISVLIMVCSMGVAAQAQVIDTFNNTSLSPYTQTIILQNGASSGIVFSDATGALTESKASGTSPEQVLFLRNDYSLTVGQMLSISAVGLITNTGYSDFGIAIASQVNPVPTVWTSGNAQSRSNYVAIYVKGQTANLGTIGFDGTVQQYSNSGLLAGGVGGNGVFSTIAGLYISEPSAGVFDVGYISTGGTYTFEHEYTFTGAYPGDTAIGTAIGIFADVRAVTSYGSLENLTLSPIPEPGTMALCGLGGLLGLAGWMRRKN